MTTTPRVSDSALGQGRVADLHGGFHRGGRQHELGQVHFALVELVADLADAHDEAVLHDVLRADAGGDGALGHVFRRVLVVVDERVDRLFDRTPRLPFPYSLLELGVITVRHLSYQSL